MFDQAFLLLGKISSSALLVISTKIEECDFYNGFTPVMSDFRPLSDMLIKDFASRD